MGGLDAVFPREFKYKVVDVKDTASVNIAGHFPSTTKWITEVINSGGSIFVHW